MSVYLCKVDVVRKTVALVIRLPCVSNKLGIYGTQNGIRVNKNAQNLMKNVLWNNPWCFGGCITMLLGGSVEAQDKVTRIQHEKSKGTL